MRQEIQTQGQSTAAVLSSFPPLTKAPSMSWLNLSHALRRDILHTAKRGLRPDEIRAAKERTAREAMEAKRAAAELDLAPKHIPPWKAEALVLESLKGLPPI